MSASERLDRSQPQAANASEKVKGLTLRAIVIAAILTFLAAKWFQISELVTVGCLVSESVPPIPAVAALMFLTALIPLWRKIMGKRALTHTEAMTIFAMMAVGVTVMGNGGLSYLFRGLLPLFYFASPSNNFADFQKYVPTWFNPRNPEVINEFFEGSYTGVTPWGAWLPYLAIWTGFFLVLFFTLMCLVRIFYDYWARQERLTFPIVQMATALGYATSSHEGQPPFFRNPLVWFGFGIAFLYDGMNMIKAFNPDFPALGLLYDFSGFFRERPWTALGGYFRWDPSLTGMGYLMSAEVLLSVIVGHFFLAAQSIGAAAVGYEAPFPARDASSAGAFLVLAFFLVWGGRRYLWQSLRHGLGAPAAKEGVPLAPRWAVRGTAVGLALLAIFFLACKLSLQRAGVGLSFWVMAAFMFLFFAFALTYARIRAEAGAPMSWLYPMAAHQYFLYNFLGSKTIFEAGGPANFMMLSNLWFLSRGYFQSEMGVQVENFRIGETTALGTGSMARAGMIGLLLGLACGIYVHLSAYYNYGSNVLLPDPENVGVYEEAIQRAKDAAHADPERGAWVTAALIGMAATAGVTFARKALFRFPLHPLGLAMGMSYGSPLWGPFLLSWVCKVVAIRIGGMKLYRRFIPLFLGLVVGHYFVGGVVWGLFGITEHPASFRYTVYFG